MALKDIAETQLKSRVIEGLIEPQEFHGTHNQKDHAPKGGGGGGGGDKDSGGAKAPGMVKSATAPTQAKVFRDPKESAKWGKRLHGDYLSKAPPDQQQALKDYVFHGDVSIKIRKGEIDEATQKRIDSFDKLFDNAPRIPHDVVVHRGMRFSPPATNPVSKAIMDGSIVGKTLRDPAYMSSSLDRSVATKYATTPVQNQINKKAGGLSKDDYKIRMEITAPKGTKALFASGGVWHGTTGPVGRAFSLNEITYPRNTAIKITSMSDPDENGFRTIKGHILPND